MNHKVLLLDFDGVISPTRYFSEIYSEEFGVDIEKLLPFFGKMKSTLNIGEGDLMEELEKVREIWEWQGTASELFEYWMQADSDLDEKVIAAAGKARENGLKVYLATDQEPYRVDYIWNRLGVKDWMDGKFVSCELKLTKAQPQFFDKILAEVDPAKPEEIVFFDDSESKVESAKSKGIDARLYTDFESMSPFLSTFS